MLIQLLYELLGTKWNLGMILKHYAISVHLDRYVETLSLAT